jgi:hypothetical protein
MDLSSAVIFGALIVSAPSAVAVIVSILAARRERIKAKYLKERLDSAILSMRSESDMQREFNEKVQ